ncbi:hypothetical protein ABPG74_003198 [Tetrahymena malaccensis]
MSISSIKLWVHLTFTAINIFYFILLREMTQGSFLMRIWNQHVYLTNITHTLVTIYYLFVTIQDICQIIKKSKIGTIIYTSTTHNYFQFVFSLSMLVGVAYWSLMIYDPKALWGSVDYQKLNIFYIMTYIHGGNHLILYTEFFFYQQYVFLRRAQKWIIGILLFLCYFTITAIQYFVFGKVVYNFQNFGFASMISIYSSFVIVFFLIEYFSLKLFGKVGLYKFSADSQQFQTKSNLKDLQKKTN